MGYDAAVVAGRYGYADPAHRPARLPRRRRLRRRPRAASSSSASATATWSRPASGGTTRSAPRSTGGRRRSGCPAPSRSASCTCTPTTRARGWAGGCCTPWWPTCRTRRPCCPPRTPTPRRSGSTTPTASSTWPAATTSRATPGPSPSSAPACRCTPRAGPGDQLSVAASPGRPTASTSSSSARATTGWSRPATWPAPGCRCEVVESDDVLGGAVSTVERWPGVRVDRGSSAHVIIRHSGIVEELDLAAHGLRYIDCDPWGFAPAPRPGRPRPRRPAAGLLRRPGRHLRLDRRRLRPRRRRRPTGGSSRCGGRAAGAVVASFGRPAHARPAWSAPSGRSARRRRPPRTPGRRAGGGLPRLRRRAAGPLVRQRAAQGGAGLVRRAVRAADVRARHRRDGRLGRRCCTTSRPVTPSAAPAGSPTRCAGGWSPTAAGSSLGDGAARLLVEDGRVTGVRDGLGTTDRAPTPWSPPATSRATRALAGDAAPPHWPTPTRRSATASASSSGR